MLFSHTEPGGKDHDHDGCLKDISMFTFCKTYQQMFMNERSPKAAAAFHGCILQEREKKEILACHIFGKCTMCSFRFPASNNWRDWKRCGKKYIFNVFINHNGQE